MAILTKNDGALFSLQINRPSRKNALTSVMYRELAEALAIADADDDVKVLLIHGGLESFTAGNDLEDFLKNPPEQEDSPVFQFLNQISRTRKPVVAAVNGPAVGVGTTMLLHCDFVYAGNDAVFALPFTSLGVVPGAASSFLLPLNAGYHLAAEALLLGQPFDAGQAMRLGFVTRVLSKENVLPFAIDTAKRLANLPRKALLSTKALLKKGFSESVKIQMAEEHRTFRELLKEPAAKEAFLAFLEKRKPDFSGMD